MHGGVDGVTRRDVVRAVQEYRRLGAEQFFSEHGFASATTRFSYRRRS
jgi:hypothetical protein